MITELTIKNFAIIDEVRLEFLAPGLNVLTGETGSGKSIILGALACILGERASTDLVRQGADKCTVEAIIALPADSSAQVFLRESELEGECGELIIRRDIHADGKSRAFINGFTVPLAKLKDLGDRLVDLHGQHQHQSLLQAEAQMQWLDKMAGIEDQLREFGEAYHRYLNFLRERDSITQRERDRAQRLEFLRFQIDEIEAANFAPGEEESLEAERRRLSNMERWREAIGAALARISDDGAGDGGNFHTALGEAMRALQPVSDWDAQAREALDALSGAQSLITEAAMQLSAAIDRAGDDPERLAEVMQRLDVWQRLKRKFGSSFDAIMESLAAMQRERKELESAEERQGSLGAEIAALEKRLPEMAARLTAARSKAAASLQKQIDAELGELGMKGARMEFRLVPTARGSEIKTGCGAAHLTSHGAEAVEFFIATNPGEDPKPLRKIASGGEISRIMLALKTVLAGRDDIPSLVFDEIDVGLGGQTAAVVGEKLRRLAATHQVICITHFAQVAAHSGRHFAIEKSMREKRAVSEVRALAESSDRVEELARLLDGRIASDISRRHAAELLAACQQETSPSGKKKRKNEV